MSRATLMRRKRYTKCILYVPSTIFQLTRDGTSWNEPVLSKDKCVLLKDHNAVTQVSMHPSKHACIQTCTCIHVHTYVHTSIHGCLHPSMDAYMHPSMHTYMYLNTNVYVHPSMLTYIYPSIHTYADS